MSTMTTTISISVSPRLRRAVPDEAANRGVGTLSERAKSLTGKGLWPPRGFAETT